VGKIGPGSSIRADGDSCIFSLVQIKNRQMMVLSDGNTMKKLWPEEKEIEPLWWWDDGPVEK